MTNRERILKIVQNDFERRLREADDEQLAMMVEDLIDYGYCAPVTSNRLRYFDEIYDFLLKKDDKVEINAEGFKDCEVKNEKVKQNMKNILEIEKKNAVKEFAEKLQKELPCRDYTFNGIIVSMILTSSMKYVIDKLLKEYEQ